ncbi:2'-5' RNA ligase family protein [Inconstantimicrobium mannanitabidum]|nr:2'-5' RNA ligase family protein [Clostridium sp. TW13]
MNSNTKKRCIMIFPRFDNINLINEIRNKYDPLANNVRPHVTLVFPFESSISTEELYNHLIERLKNVSSFHLNLQDIIKVDDTTGMYLFLSVKDGIDKIKDIHTKLYSGMLEEYKPAWLNEVNFMPHMTIGNFTNRSDLNKAYEDVCSIRDDFDTLVEKISVEIIDENEDSIIEIEIPLSKTI